MTLSSTNINIKSRQLSENDKLLLSVSEGRDKLSFRKLYDFFSPRIKGYIMKLGSDELTAEEITQETMDIVWRKAHTYNSQSSGANTWIFTIARNKRVDHLRKYGKKLPDLDDISLKPEEEIQPDDVLFHKEIKSSVSSALKNISPDQAKIVFAAYYQGKTHKEISEDLKIPLGTVKSRVRLALNNLKKIIVKVEGYK